MKPGDTIRLQGILSKLSPESKSKYEVLETELLPFLAQKGRSQLTKKHVQMLFNGNSEEFKGLLSLAVA